MCNVAGDRDAQVTTLKVNFGDSEGYTCTERCIDYLTRVDGEGSIGKINHAITQPEVDIHS